MTGALLGVILATQVSAPRLRTILPNGAIVLVESMPQAKALSVQLFASSRGVEETPERHGWRHLLEHLTLKGRDPKSPLDNRIEAKGLFLQGKTYRDAMQIEVTAKPGQLEEALAILREVTQPLETTPEEIAAEVNVMREEFALAEDAIKLGRGAWEEAYGEAGLDAGGNLESIAKATPEGLRETMDRMLAPANLVLVISGPIKIEDATALGKSFLLSRRGDPPKANPRGEPKSGRAAVDDAFGEGRAVPVGSLTDPATVTALVGAFGITARIPGAFVTYTPNGTRGLVAFGQTDATGGVGLMIDEFEESDLAQVYGVGRNLMRRWLGGYLSDPSGNGYLRGLLLLDNPTARAEDVGVALEGLTFAQFKKEFARFGKDKAVTFVGSSR